MSDSTHQEEFIGLLSDCQSRIRATIFALIHDMHDVEEVYQNACLVMWRKFDSYRPDTQFAKWACSIAYLEVKKYLSQKQKGTRFSRAFLEQFMTWEKTRPEAADDCFTQELHSCMERLGANDRQVLQLRYWEKKHVYEIAADMGRTPQSVSNTLGRIRMQLMECIKHVRAIKDA